MKVKNKDPWIWTQSNVISEDFCNHIINKFENDEDKYPGMTFGGVDLNVKKSTDLNASRNPRWRKELKYFHDILTVKFEEYGNHIIKYFDDKIKSEVYDFIAPGAPVFFSSGQNIQRTQIGENYDWHNDAISWDNFYRCFTYIFYLNDVKYGGSTQFIDGTRIRAEQGKLLIFPATFTYIHRGEPPTSNVKYISTGWMNRASEKFENAIDITEL